MEIAKTLRNIALLSAGTLIFAFHNQNAFSQQNYDSQNQKLIKYEDSLFLWNDGQNNLIKAITQIKGISRQYNEPLRPNENFSDEKYAYVVFKDFVGRADLHPHKNHAQTVDGEIDYKKYAVNEIEPVQVYHLDLFDFSFDKRTHTYFPIYEKPSRYPHINGELITPANYLNVLVVSVKEKNGNYRPAYYQNPRGERIPYGDKFNRDWQYGLERKKDLIAMHKD